jgi:hypothetical protein
MSSSTENDTAGADQSDFLTEATLENLKALRGEMLQSYRGFFQKSREFELADTNKYLVLSNIKETTIFKDDSEDMGVTEDLTLLDIK